MFSLILFLNSHKIRGEIILKGRQLSMQIELNKSLGLFSVAFYLSDFIKFAKDTLNKSPDPGDITEGLVKKYRLQHDRENCIGCGACAVIAPEFWEMNDDGKSDIIDGENKENKWQLL